jgi:hypothetical protein
MLPGEVELILVRAERRLYRRWLRVMAKGRDHRRSGTSRLLTKIASCFVVGPLQLTYRRTGRYPLDSFYRTNF